MKPFLYKLTPSDVTRIARVNDIKRASLSASSIVAELKFWCAAEVLMKTFGSEWINESIGQDFGGEPYAHLASTLPAERTAVGKNGTVFFLHRLSSLQDCVGFEALLKDISNKGYLGAVFQVMAGYLFLTAGISFEFVKARGIKGQDYDIDVKFESSLISVEAKSIDKAEGSVVNGRSIVSQLRKADKQVHPKRPALAIVRVPQSWLKDGYQHVQKSVKSYLGNVERLQAVILNSDAYHLFEMDGDVADRLVPFCGLAAIGKEGVSKEVKSLIDTIMMKLRKYQIPDNGMPAHFMPYDYMSMVEE